MTTVVWIAAGAVSTGGVSAVAIKKLWKSKAQKEVEKGTHDEQ
jgi:hypothetical protein